MYILSSNAQYPAGLVKTRSPIVDWELALALQFTLDEPVTAVTMKSPDKALGALAAIRHHTRAMQSG